MFSTIDIPGATYNWTVSPSSGNSVSWNGSQAEVIISSQCILGVEITTPCGTTSASRKIFLKSPDQCNGGCSLPSYTYSYTITPNPAQNTIKVASNNENNDVESMKFEAQHSSATHSIKQVKIYNASGKLTKQQLFSGNSAQIEMDISQLLNGIYFVKIFDGKNRKIQKLVISR